MLVAQCRHKKFASQIVAWLDGRHEFDISVMGIIVAI